MNEETKVIKLSSELYDKLDLSENNEVEVVEHSNHSFILRSLSNPAQDNATRWFWIPTVISMLIFLGYALITHVHSIHLTGSSSIATAVLIVANAISAITFIVAYIKKRKDLYNVMTSRSYWRGFITVVLSVIIISSLSLVALFWFISQIFYGVIFDIFTATVIFTVFSAILNYFMIFIVDTFSIKVMLNMLILVSTGGVISSMATSGNPYWWQRNFSLLGTETSKSNWQFNLTLVVSAGLMIALFDYLFVSIRERYGLLPRHIILQTLLTLGAICIALVGLIPDNGDGLMHVVHFTLAQMIVFFLGISILSVHWLLPNLSKEFHSISYAIIGVLVVSYLLWHPVHYLTLTGFEILSFSLGFAWIMLLISNLSNLLFGERKIYKVEKIKE
ncbi:MAG: DUF998 domain-containing protein [Streptococcaceae bacterium]|nr:DUF998 domain-containing protein [Streptococcaceae bacterium]MCL2681091.1 DUF998 domain-containing protein [Streptococcaceae bacterium]